MLGKLKEKEGEAILIITAKVPDNFEFDLDKLTEIFKNDIYSSY